MPSLDDINRLLLRHGTDISRWSVVVTAVVAAICLLWLSALRIFFRVSVDYTAVGELLLVLVIAVEGGVAVATLRHDQRSARAVANGAVYDLYKTYLSVEYHQNVRRPAWYALSRSVHDAAYRDKVLAGLAGILAGEEVDAAYNRKREGKKLTQEDAESFAFHNEYHRIQDVLGFFAMLSALSGEADPEILRTCDFFYDRWRVLLHIIVELLGSYNLPDKTVSELKNRRWKIHCDSLCSLDRIFGYEKVDWKTDPLFRNTQQAGGA
jgi:hypothetical protein